MDHSSIGFLGGSLWLLIAAIAAGTGLAIFTYRYTVPRTTRTRKNVLIAFRSLGIAALLFAIFQPIVARTSVDESRPSIAMVLDRSESMQLLAMNANGDTTRTRLHAMKESVNAAIPAAMRNDSNQLATYTVGEQTESVRTPYSLDSLRGNASQTDLASSFTTLAQARATKNIQAVVLYTDGAFTAGASPIYPAIALGVPVYAVGLGDSAELRDLAITELFTNEVATVGAAQPVDALLHAAGVRAGERALVQLFAESEKIAEKALQLNAGTTDVPINFSFTPTKEGIVKLTVRVTPIDGEITLKNNLREQYVRVLKNKFKVTLIAGAPSPDVEFIKSYLESTTSLDVHTFIQKEGADFYQGALTPAALNETDVFLLVGFPVSQTSDATIRAVGAALTQRAKPLLFIASHTLDYTRLSMLGDVLPFRTDGLRNIPNEIKVTPSIAASVADDPILHIPPAEREAMNWQTLAPLFKTETHIEPRAESRVLLDATLQGVRLGDPLLLSRRVGESRVLALTGYGIWQWKLSTYGRERAFLAETHSHDSTKLASESALEVFMDNALRWLTTREDNKRVRIEPERRFYEAGEKIVFGGEVYDESYRPIEDASVTLRLTGAKLSQPLELSLTAVGNGRYSAAIPSGLAAGDYSYSGSASRNGKALGSDNGRLSVGEFNIEYAEPRMRSDILRELAARTGGKFYTPETAGSILRDIQQSSKFQPRKVEHSEQFNLWNAWPLLALALAFFSTEWFMRKRIGML